MGTPKLSIITVCYNAINFIGETIESVLGQSYIENVEYILIDGGSTDGTYEVIHGFGSQIDKIVHESDKGIYDAMNKGVSLASGEYVFFLNAGDKFYSSDTLEKLSSSLKDGDVIYGNTCLRIKDGPEKIINYFSLDKDWKVIPYCHQSVFIRRSLLLDYVFDLNFKIAADFNQYHQLKNQKVKFKSIDQTISIYDNTGFSSLNHRKLLQEYRKISRAYNSGFLKRLKLESYFFLKIILNRR
jgi:glycosyltransferase involved in cell wall biosynthesis